jgi:hypothetical protein
MRKIVKTLFGIAALVAMASIATPAAACELSVGTPVAAEVQHTVNTLVDTHRTTCQPADANGKCSIVCSTGSRVEAVEPWAFVVASAAGMAAREKGLSKFADVRVLDRRMTERRTYLRTDIAKASAFQQAVASNRIDMRAALGEWVKATETVSIPAK